MKLTRWPLAAACLGVGLFFGVLLAGTGLIGRLPLAVGQPAPPPVNNRDLFTFRDVVKQVVPAVVSIEARAKPKAVPGRRPRAGDPDVPEELRRFLEERDAPAPTPDLGFGSGFIVDPAGVILTNFHVVEGADSVEVVLQDGRKFISKDIVTDKKTDLAIVRITPKGAALPSLAFGDSDGMDVGDRVLAVGAPFGLTGSVTHGIVSAKSRNLRMNHYEDFLQTDAAINPGNSGGPLVNMEGKVIGINSAIKSRSGGFQGVGLAISSNLARNVMGQLLKDGVVKRGYLGIQMKDLDPEVATALGIKEGVVVTRVFENSPAAKGGLQAGDVLLSITGKPVRDGRELQRLVAALTLGKPAEVEVLRDRKPVKLELTVQEQPEEFGAARVPVPVLPRKPAGTVKVEKYGLEAAALTAEAAESLGYKDGDKGALVFRVEAGSVAESAGLSRGMLVEKVGETRVTTPAELKDALDAAPADKGVLVQVLSPVGGRDLLVLKP